tara:strand:- start:8950 stop:10098 length:1149 start_codon:yes stop_codon:yes gene_type:complete
MTNNVLLESLSVRKELQPSETFNTQDEYVLGYSSVTFNIIATKAICFRVYAGRHTDANPPVIVKKTLKPNTIYSRTIGVVANYVYITIENESGTETPFVTLDSQGQYIRAPNSLVRQHVEVDATNNINLTKQGSVYHLDLSRGLLQNQEPVDIYGTASGMGSNLNTLWEDTTKTVFDGLSIGVSCQIQSDNINDTLGGSGGVCVKVVGLKSDFSKAEETVQMNGLTPVPLTTEFLRVNQAVVTNAGTGLTNKGNIEINPIYDTSLILERIAALRGKSATFHYSVPKNEELVVTNIEMNTAIQDPAEFDLTVQDVLNPGVSGAPILKKSLKFGGITNGAVNIDVQEKFTMGQTITLDITSKATPLGINSVYATCNGARINTIL